MNDADVLPKAAGVIPSRPNLRHVAVHLHIFKNAGTSFDRFLSTCFGDTMANFDKRSRGATLTIAETADFIEKRPALRCLSSHQVRMPLPVTDGLMLHPMFFLRNPVERVQSCFHFERDVQKVYPESLTMEDYVRRNLNVPRVNAVVNLQTSVLCDNRMISEDRAKSEITPAALASAIAALHQSPGFGLVEHFNESLTLIKSAYLPYFAELSASIPDAPIRENVSENGLSESSEKLRYVKDSLTPATYLRLLDQTAADRQLYEEGRKIFFGRHGHQSLSGSRAIA